MLSYILIHRNGDVYNRLLGNLKHHSLSQLLIELLNLKIVATQQTSSARDRFSSDFDKETSSDLDKEGDEEKKESDPTDGMTIVERKMFQVLETKKQEVIQYLIQRLSSKNPDFEECLNAHSILIELTENEQTYSKLVEKENLTHLIKAACDINNIQNQAYALNVIIHIIREFPDFDKRIGALAGEFTQTIGNHFLDITYSCLLIIRQQYGEEVEDNQSGIQHRKFGFRRLKAVELIR